MRGLVKRIYDVLPEVATDYEVTLTRIQINSMLRTAMHQGAELVLEDAERGKLVRLDGRKGVEIVRLQRIRDFVEGVR